MATAHIFPYCGHFLRLGKRGEMSMQYFPLCRVLWSNWKRFSVCVCNEWIHPHAARNCLKSFMLTLSDWVRNRPFSFALMNFYDRGHVSYQGAPNEEDNRRRLLWLLLTGGNDSSLEAYDLLNLGVRREKPQTSEEFILVTRMEKSWQSAAEPREGNYCKIWWTRKQRENSKRGSPVDDSKS